MFLIWLPLVFGFRLAPFDTFQQPKVFRFCSDSSPLLEQTSREVAQGLPLEVIFDPMGDSSICDIETNYYARTLTIHAPPLFHTNIEISRRVLFYPIVLHNIILHEMLHSLGLKHSDRPGIMNYSLLTFNGVILDDRRRLWLSMDDLNGLYSLSNRNER